MSNGIVDEQAMTITETGDESTKTPLDIHMADIDDPDFVIEDVERAIAEEAADATETLYGAQPAGLPGPPGALPYPPVPAPGPKKEADTIKKYAGGAAVAGAALAAGAGLLYWRAKPPRKRKTRTEGQTLGLVGLGIGAVAAVLGGAAYLTSSLISRRISPPVTKQPWSPPGLSGGCPPGNICA